MPKFGKYGANSAPSDAAIFVAKQGAETVTYTLADIKAAAKDLDITDYAASQAIIESQMGGVIRFTASATGTLPEITTAMIGKFIIIGKRTTADVQIDAGGTDVFVEAGTTSLKNSNAAENWADIWLIPETAGVWSILNQLGTWA